MNRRSRVRALLAVGLGAAWVAWGNVTHLVSPFPVPACGIADPRGLHVDGLGRLAYANDQCPMVVYEGAWAAFGVASLVALSLLASGVALRVRGGD